MRLKSEVYNSLKIAAALLVVLGHATRMYVGDGVVTPLLSSKLLKAGSLYIYSFHMPLFFLISGCIYGWCIEHGKYNDNVKFLKNKIKRLIIPYFVFGILYVAPVMCLLKFWGGGFWEYVWKGIVLSRNSRHLWYVPALLWIFISTVGVKKLIKTVNPLFILIPSFLIAYLSQKVFFNFFQLHSALYYQFFFYLGVYVNRYYDRIAAFAKKNFFITILCPFILLAKFRIDLNILTTFFYQLTGIYMMLSLIILIDLPRVRECSIYHVLNRNCFALYLFHPMIIYVIYYFLGALPIPPFILGFGSAAVSAVLSILLAELVRRAKLSLIIGE